MTAWEIVGVPIGSPAWVDHEASRISQEAAAKANAIADLEDPHAAYAVHQFCASFPAIVYHLRILGGDRPAWKDFDWPAVDDGVDLCVELGSPIGTQSPTRRNDRA